MLLSLLPLVVLPLASVQGGLVRTSSIAKLGRLDELPLLRPGVKVGAVTSYDRTGGNDDGFAGTYSFVRKEGDTLVLADLKGPGCITRIHTPTPSDEPLEFYFDGETTPRVAMKYSDLFSGEIAPFVQPLVDSVGGGNYSYVPMPYAKSCKVVLRAPRALFYDINYATYPEGTKLETFDPKRVAQADLDRAIRLFNAGLKKPPLDLSLGSTSNRTRMRFSLPMKAGAATTIFEAKKGGRIGGITLGPASAFAGKARDTVIRVTWDGEQKPAIEMPVGDFFGYAWGEPATQSALYGTTDDTNYCYFPMPFDRSAKIELVSLAKGEISIPVTGEVITTDEARKAGEGRFYAVWRRENPTTEGEPFTWLDTMGVGHVVGLSVQAQGKEAGNTFFFEGDDISTIDGEMAIHGTGSEDFFNGGWYDVPGRWDSRFSRGLSGCLAYQRYLGRTGAYRLLLEDAYSFGKSIRQTIEHAPVRNEHPADYAGVAYLYALAAPTFASSTQYAVEDPSRLVYSAHWTMPIEAFSLANSTLTRGDVPAGLAPNGDGRTRALTLRAQRDGDFDICFVTLRADVPAAGRYRVKINAVTNADSSRIGMFQEDVPLGPLVDLYADKPTIARDVLVGEFTARSGGNALMFKLFPREGSTARGMDLMDVILERID